MSYGSIEDEKINAERASYKEAGFEYAATAGTFTYYDNKEKMLRVGVSFELRKMFVESISPIKKHFSKGKRKMGIIPVPTTEFVKAVMQKL